MKRARSTTTEPEVTPEIDRGARSRLAQAAVMADDAINLLDPDAPGVTDWSAGERGRFFKPVKRLKSFRTDADVLA